jgi:PEP-CTERM motif
MNKYLIAVVMVVLVAAGYSQRSEASPCSFFTRYANLPSQCDIGDKTFSDFTYLSTGANPVNAFFVGVVSIAGPPEWGFQFTFGLNAVANQRSDIILGYTVTCNALAAVFNCIDSDELLMTGTVTSGGIADVEETVNGFTFFFTSAGSPSAAISFAGVHTEDVSVDIFAACAANPTDCSAQISAVRATVDQVQVPEPATWALLGAGLFSLAAFGRRKLR